MPSPKWLLLIHQLPAKPAYVRVKIWRRLQALGAVTVKNAVYALPANDESREDFAWLCQGDRGGGRRGDRLRGGAGRRASTTTRSRACSMPRATQDYAEIAEEARARRRSAAGEASRRRARRRRQRRSARLRKQLDAVIAIDFFGANGRETGARAWSSGLEASFKQGGDAVQSKRRNGPARPAPLKQRIWVTREGVQVDRIASAWLIRRFIDRRGALQVRARRAAIAPQAGELRFDMFEGEFTHEGDRCTFEVLLARRGPRPIRRSARSARSCTTSTSRTTSTGARRPPASGA